MNSLIIDLETSINKGGAHGPDSKDLNNDFYTLITGVHPNEIEVQHNAQGFNRELPDNLLDSIDILVGHNILFDLGYIYNTNAFQQYLNTNKEIWDTGVAEYLMTGQRHKTPSLAELQGKYLGQRTKADRISRLFKRGIGADKILAARNTCRRLFRLYEFYCQQDGATTLQIFAQQYREAKRIGMLPIIKAHMRGLLAVLVMEKTGINIDVDKCQKTLRDFRIKSIEQLERATALITHLWDERLGSFNINSPKQKSAILFGGDFTIKERVENGAFKNGTARFKMVNKSVHINGFALATSLSKSNKKGDGYVTDASVITKIINNSDNKLAIEYCKLQKEAMRYGKMCSTYLEPFLEKSVNGLLFPHYNTTQTATGRLSSSSPNLQNVPASGQLLIPIQGQLIAPEGWVCCDIDYSSLEVWVLALLSGDKVMTNDLLSGVDFHVKRLSWIPRLSEGKSYTELMKLCKSEPEWALKRKKAKGVSFKKAYGGGAKSLAEAEGLAVEDVQAIFDKEDLEYPYVKMFNECVMDTVLNNQHISKFSDYPKSGRGGRKFCDGIELLPIYSRNNTEATYNENEYRHYGVYTSLTGRKYTFEEFGRIDKNGQLHRHYSSTETKNYMIQGTAADVVQIAAYNVMKYVLQHSTEVRMVRQIHDSLGFYIKKGLETLHIPKIKCIMSDIPKHFKGMLDVKVAFKFPCEAKIGANFAEMREVL